MLNVFKRTQRIGKAHLNTLLKTLERSKPVLEQALKDLETRGVELRTKAYDIKSTVKDLENKQASSDIINNLISLAEKLEAQSLECKRKYNKLNLKLSELDARQQYAETLKSLAGIDDGSISSIVEEAEKFVTSIENEAKAIMDFKQEV